MSEKSELLDQIAAKDALIADLRAQVATLTPTVYVPAKYPAMRYHANGAVKIIGGPAEESAEWGDVPCAVAVVSYPAYLYKGGAKVLVTDAAAHAVLGDGWTATP